RPRADSGTSRVEADLGSDGDLLWVFAVPVRAPLQGNDRLSSARVRPSAEARACPPPATRKKEQRRRRRARDRFLRPGSLYECIPQGIRSDPERLRSTERLTPAGRGRRLDRVQHAVAGDGVIEGGAEMRSLAIVASETRIRLRDVGGRARALRRRPPILLWHG